jgi:hypothetical protein
MKWHQLPSRTAIWTASVRARTSQRATFGLELAQPNPMIKNVPQLAHMLIR